MLNTITGNNISITNDTSVQCPKKASQAMIYKMQSNTGEGKGGGGGERRRDYYRKIYFFGHPLGKIFLSTKSKKYHNNISKSIT